MDEPSRRLNWIVWSGLALTMAGIVALYCLVQLRQAARSSAPPLPVLGQVTDFTLTNQEAQAVSLSSLRGRIWIADIIFTRCAGPCLVMSRQMSGLQAALPDKGQVRLVSLTADPQFDTPPVLKRYAERFRADSNTWAFLTGPKTEIYRLATKDLLLVAVETKVEERASPDDLFLHSTKFILVDRQGRLRGVFDGDREGAQAELVRSVATLLKES